MDTTKTSRTASKAAKWEAEHRNNIRAWTALKEEAARQDLPKAYHADLDTHDLKAVTDLGSNKPFLWALRECGTHLIPVDTKDAHKWIKGIAQVWKDALWYHWDGVSLRSVTAHKAVEIVTPEQDRD